MMRDQYGESDTRMTVKDAARALSISEQAVRARINRRTLRSENVDGTRYVYLPEDTTQDAPSAAPSDTLAAKDAHIADLREQLAAEREARRRADVLLDRLTARIPALPPGQAGDTTVQEADTTGEGYDTPTTPADRTGDSRRPWYRRWFGAE